MWIIFGSGGNVCVVVEPFSKSWFGRINTNSVITPPNNLDMVTF
jgi:hypothetical protein